MRSLVLTLLCEVLYFNHRQVDEIEAVNILCGNLNTAFLHFDQENEGYMSSVIRQQNKL